MQLNGRRMLSLVQSGRALAVIFILLGHANKVFKVNFDYDWFNTGDWVRTGGVDFFFIVSGFMMFYLYHKYIGQKGKAKEFLIKRFIKIYPLQWIFTLAVLVLFFVFPQTTGSHPKTMEVIIKSLLLLPTTPILDLTWSLSYVILFYIVFSFLIYKPTIMKPVITCWIIFCILSETKVIPNVNSFLFNFSNLEIMGGSAIAYLVLKNNKLKFPWLFIVFGMFGFLLVWTNNVTHIMRLQDDYFYFLSSSCLMLGMALIDMKKDIQLPKSMSIVSDSSYSIYISQMPILHFFTIILSKLGIVALIGPAISIWVAILFTISSGCAVYYIIEKPISNFLKNKLLRHSGKSPINKISVPLKTENG